MIESEEMKPKWFEIKDLPYDQMWQADKFWHPYFFQRQKFQSYFLYDKHNKIMMHDLNKLVIMIINKSK